ncbi:thioesterase family protein [Salinactinospora qingdaonensis]
MTRFDSATTVTKVGSGHYTAQLDGGYLIGAALNGGYLMAVLQRAALLEAERPHALAVSSSYHFLRPGAGGPAEVAATVLKAGRTITTVQVTLYQNDKPLVSGLIAIAEFDAAATPVYQSEPVEIPPIEQCHRLDPRERQAENADFLERVDQYYSPATYELLGDPGTEKSPDLRGHVRLSELDGGDPEDPTLFLPLAIDALPPVVSALLPWNWAPTVELTWHMRAVPEAGPLAFHARSDTVADGWFDETVDLWDTKGRLVAQSRQLARIGR